MSTITTSDGTEIYFKDWEEGPAVTFSHGWPLSADAWDGQMLFLAEHGFRCIAHDRRGHGRSSQPSSGNDMDTYADDLAALIDALGLDDVAVVGHSTGGGEVSNAPAWDDAAVLEFFETSTRHILDGAARAGAGHLVALSVVGSERLPESGYLRAKTAQEKLIGTSAVPYSIVHATQFFEFVTRIADEATDGTTVRLPPVRFQPIAADDVAAIVTEVALGTPVMGTIEIAGPEQFRFDELVQRDLVARGDRRVVVADPHARYFGTELEDRSLVPGDGAVLAPTRYEDWFARSADGA